ncbi:hypothetical protein [Rothia nasimurium]|uniref:hypothetical protein n=1 Tax=Rothia nasimurium TaxID=85336 RepID=UPI003BA181A7
MESTIAIIVLIVLALFVINFALGLAKTVLKLVFSPAGAILGGVAAIIFIFGG